MAYGKRLNMWNDEDTKKARELIAAGADNSTFLREIGRSKPAAYARIRYVDCPETYRLSRLREKAKAVEYSPPFRIPSEVLEAARLRLSANLSLTAILCGDPRPGQSALDRKQLAEASV